MATKNNKDQLSPKPLSETSAKRPPTKRETFLFVNKDVHSEVLSRSENSSAAASINSHVQRWQRKEDSSGGSRAKATPATPRTVRIPAHKKYATKFRPKPARKNVKAEKMKVVEVAATTIVKSSVTPTSLQNADSSRVIISAGSSNRIPESTEKMSRETDDWDVVELPRNNSNVETHHRHHHPQQPTSPAPLQLLTANFSGPDCIDPFRVTSLPLGRDVHSILQYYISFTLVSTFQSSPSSSSSKAPPPEPTHFPAIRAIVTNSLTNQMHMYALLAATAGRMKHVSGVSFPQDAPSSPAFLMHRAIRALRSYFSDSSAAGDIMVDRQVILDIFYLCVCEWYEGSHSNARTHLSFVRHFWGSLRLGKEGFDRYVHDVICYNDVFLAIEMGGSPILGLTWEPGPLGLERMKEVEEEVKRFQTRFNVQGGNGREDDGSLTTTTTTTTPIPGEGFTSLLQRCPLLFSHGFSGIVTDLVPLISVTTLHQSHQNQRPIPAGEARYLSLKTQSLLHRLLSLPDSADTRSVESIVSLALVITLSCLATSAAWREGKVDLRRLGKRLRGFLDGREGKRTTGLGEGLMLWVLFTGAFAARELKRDGRDGDEAWFRERAGKVLKGMEGVEGEGGGTGMGLERVRGELVRWFYIEDLLGGSVRGLLDKGSGV